MGEKKLVGASELLAMLWTEKCRPSLRWLRQQTKARRIPFSRCGKFVWFDPEAVREALAMRARGKGGAR